MFTRLHRPVTRGRGIPDASVRWEELCQTHTPPDEQGESGFPEHTPESLPCGECLRSMLVKFQKCRDGRMWQSPMQGQSLENQQCHAWFL